MAPRPFSGLRYFKARYVCNVDEGFVTKTILEIISWNPGSGSAYSLGSNADTQDCAVIPLIRNYSRLARERYIRVKRLEHGQIWNTPEGEAS